LLLLLQPHHLHSDRLHGQGSEHHLPWCHLHHCCECFAATVLP
jgi:hypothetical protein